MKKPDIPANEKERLDALYAYDLMTHISPREFQHIVELAALICETPISLITLVNGDTQIHKAKFGLERAETHRDISFCAHAINTPYDLFEVADATNDERFFDNPMVTGDPHIVFYAGMPLVTENGYGLGTLCVIDSTPHHLNPDQRRLLKGLARQIVRLFELKKTVKILEEKENILDRIIKELEEFTSMVSHDLKTSFRNIEISTEIIHKINNPKIAEISLTHIGNIQKESIEAIRFINDVSTFSKSITAFNENRSLIDMNKAISATVKKIKVPGHFKVEIAKNLPVVFTSRTALQHIFENLLQNSVKYMDKPDPVIKVTYEKNNGFHIFGVEDNGAGIAVKHIPTIFDLYNKGAQRKNPQSTGVGLAIVKKLVNLINGKITVKSSPGKGTRFEFAFPVR